MLCQQKWNQCKETERCGGAPTEWETGEWRGAWEHEPWLKGRKGSKGVFGMRVKIKQTFRRKKSCLVSSIKYKLNFNAETPLDLFYKWWCFDLEAQNVHGFPELRAVFSTERSLQFMVLLPNAVYICCSPSMKITEIFDHSPRPCTDPNWPCSWSAQGRLTGTFCPQNSEETKPVPGP